MNRFFDHIKIGTEQIKDQSTQRNLAVQTFFSKKPNQKHNVQNSCTISCASHKQKWLNKFLNFLPLKNPLFKGKSAYFLYSSKNLKKLSVQFFYSPQSISSSISQFTFNAIFWTNYLYRWNDYLFIIYKANSLNKNIIQIELYTPPTPYQKAIANLTHIYTTQCIVITTPMVQFCDALLSHLCHKLIEHLLFHL